MTDENIGQYLHSIYYSPDSPASFSGAQKLYEHVKTQGLFQLSKYRIQKWLSTQQNYSLHKPSRVKNFKRRPVISSDIDFLWEADIGFIESRAKYNNGYKYVLVVIDVLSKYLFALPLKDKRAASIIRAFKIIFARGRQCTQLRTDHGSEFVANSFQKFIGKFYIKHYTTNSDKKANSAERVWRSIKNRLFKYMSAKTTNKWVHVLDDFVISYNNTKHSSHGRIPAELGRKDAAWLIKKLYMNCDSKPTKKQNKTKTPIHSTKVKPELKQSQKQVRNKIARSGYVAYKFKLSSYVRISKTRHAFVKELHHKWTVEVFKIVKRKKIDKIVLYFLEDLQNDPIKGSFQYYELQQVQDVDNIEWKIEEIVDKRIVRKKTQVKVKWEGFPAKFNSWLAETELVKL